MLTPIKLKAPLKDYLWGGTRLKEQFGKHTDMDIVAESWELSCHKDGLSVVDSGEDKGITLDKYIEKHGKDILGDNCKDKSDFPFLIKLIDAAKSLSVQVHPDNAYALKNEGEQGKTEMWYIVDCKPGAELLYGFKKKISKDEFVSRIKDNTLLDVTNNVPVHKGDVFFIEAGTLHAIGEGILIAEVQQSSNSTYRIYDFGRVGADGKPRELHIDKAVDVTKLEKPTRDCKPQGKPALDGDMTSTLLAKCEYFTVKALSLEGTKKLVSNADSFTSLLCLDGSFTLTFEDTRLLVKKGESVFVPAGIGQYIISGQCDMLMAKI